MNLPKELQRKKRILVKMLRRHGVLQAGIFGSYARGEQKKRSDVDILVKTKKGTSLFDFIGIKHDAEKVLGKTVDLVEYSAIKPRIKEQILHDEVRIL
ncbi:nucleotidyltransferase family protein [Candidatus Woesearchaeota archaeon]|nr:nucleotidyltransferase family protein [Candidatus Woesearchaeota archaeon]